MRLWAVVQEDQQQANGTTRGGGGSSGTAAAAPHGSLGKSALAASLLRYAPKPRIWTDRHSYAAIQEALLVGHEDWVHSVAWQPPVTQPDGTRSQPACLLSASMDRTMMLWCRDAATGWWGGVGSAPHWVQMFLSAASAAALVLPVVLACRPCVGLPAAAAATPPSAPRCSKQHVCHVAHAVKSSAKASR